MGSFMVLRGFIDDSGTGDLFTLSCLTGDSPNWVWIEFEWLKILNKKNAELAAAGRKQIRRFHATDCGSRRNDFEGWDVKTEQIPFMAELIAKLEKYRLDVTGFTINLKELAKYVPASRHNPLRFAHVMLLHYIMMEIEVTTLAREPDAILGLIHDRGKFDSVLLDSFNILINDPLFKSRRRFTTIAPMGWEDCVPLQPADLMAYENFKECERELYSRKRHKSLEIILDKGQMGGSLRSFNKETLIKYAEWFDNLSDEAKTLMYDAARVPDKFRKTKNEAKRSIRKIQHDNGHDTQGRSRGGKSRDGSGETRASARSAKNRKARTGKTA